MPEYKITGRMMLAFMMIPLFLVSSLFVLFGNSVFILFAYTSIVMLLMGIYWKTSDMVKERGELQTRLAKAEKELEAIKDR